MSKKLVKIAAAGYMAGAGGKNPHEPGTSDWRAFEAGRAVWNKGVTEPYDVRFAAGKTVKVETTGGAIFSVSFAGSEITIERDI